mmetsp:Transcript_39463/g.64572  ORF Transcript_39463/g.64572 Transcript_39463/m.64572 type:complete len:200 (+) Transcript_39463:312-911(+)
MFVRARVMMDIPHQHRVVRRRGHQLRVIRIPPQRCDFGGMTAQRGIVVPCVRLVNLYRRGVDGSKILSAIREANFSAAFNGEVFAATDIIHQHIHQSQFVGKSHHEMQAARMQRDTQRLLSKGLGEHYTLLVPVPNLDTVIVAATRSQIRFTHAQIQTSHRFVMKRCQQILKLFSVFGIFFFFLLGVVLMVAGLQHLNL